MRLSALFAVFALSFGCYQDPEALRPEEVITLTVPDEADALRADGRSVIELVVSVDPRTSASLPIRLSATSGSFRLGAPVDGELRDTEVHHAPGTGVLRVPFQLGVEPGPLYLSAELEGIVAEAEIRLAPALPDGILLDGAPRVLTANGQEHVTVEAQLVAFAAEVSTGLLLETDLCCGADRCQPAVPVSVPRFVPYERPGPAAIPVTSVLWRDAAAAERIFALAVAVWTENTTTSDDLCAGRRSPAARIELVVRPSP